MSINHFFSTKIQRWYSKHKRDLPWRQNNDPYRIWLSEVILQQTRVVYGESYFKRFTSTFPTIYDLANAPEDQVLKLWQGLGYYSRARNLHKTAKLITNEFNGVFPNDYKLLLSLPGIGPYTAAAISSICFHLPHAVVDGNVYRVLARFFGIEDPIDTGQAKKRFEALANELIDEKQPGNYNQAIMEFGALVCKPKDPNYLTCCLNKSCKYFKSNKKIKSIKNKKNKNKNYNIFCYLNKKKQIALTKNSQIGFLKNFNLPEIKEANGFSKKHNWKFLKNYKNSISNLKLNINIYYKFSNKIPSSHRWYSLEKNNEFIPNFTKKIFRQVSSLF